MSTSRFEGNPTYVARVAGAEREVQAPRRPRTAGVLRWHTVRPGERIDLIAWRYYRDPLQAWRILDANPAARAEDLEEPGRVLCIPEAG